jgi:hypothetical protein
MVPMADFISMEIGFSKYRWIDMVNMKNLSAAYGRQIY